MSGRRKPGEAPPVKAWSKNDRLTEKQMRFVDQYLELGDATAAARNSGHSGSRHHASNMLRTPKIAAEIKRRQDERAARHDITLDSLTRMTMDAYEKASSKEDPASMVAAVRQLSKMHGFDVKDLRGDFQITVIVKQF